ncbi:hypothetical protein QM012_004544 [Aureobasidium pullulans]|uniref:DUF7702 domain-containing protein n=1 Tax=Aureobasidium pullulans TaxID=5580 RepID=A0ABR0TV52_AURPU
MYSDGVFRYRDGISVVQIITFSISFIFAVSFYWTQRIGWFCIGAFSLIRLVSASCYLAIMNNDSDSLWATVFVCESLGIMLIIFLFLELLYHVNKTTPVVDKRYFYAPQLLTWIDIIISIVGYIAIKNKDHNQLDPTPYDQASRAIVTVIYVYTLWLLWIFWHFQDLSTYALPARRAIRCVAYCIPLMIVRLVYSLIFEATGDRTFNSSKGDPTAYLTMTYLPELGIIAICTATIVGIPPMGKSKEGIEGSSELEGHNDGEIDETGSHHNFLRTQKPS